MKGNFILLGATGGIGRAVAGQLGGNGSRLFLGARDAGRLARLASELGADHAVCDATRPEQVDALFAKASERLGEINGVAHCVGSMTLKSAHITSDSEWDETIRVNLTSAFYVLRAAARAMMSSGGSVVLMSSVASKIGIANHEAIAAAKAGINGLVLSAAATYGARGLRVNAVAPGLVDTPLAELITGNPAARKASEAMHPLGRIGRPEEVAAAILWLLDPAQGWVTGQIVSVDGGLSTVRART